MNAKPFERFVFLCFGSWMWRILRGRVWVWVGIGRGFEKISFRSLWVVYWGRFSMYILVLSWFFWRDSRLFRSNFWALFSFVYDLFRIRCLEDCRAVWSAFCCCFWLVFLWNLNICCIFLKDWKSFRSMKSEYWADFNWF